MTKNILGLIAFVALLIGCFSSKQAISENKAEQGKMKVERSAAEILGNANYLAMSFGGYRQKTRDIQPTIAELKEDMKILSAMGVKIIRTYHTKLPHAGNVLRAIRQLKQEDQTFEMYVMLGIWIDCEKAWTDSPNHEAEDEQANRAEVERAVQMAQEHEDIVKILAVGNEAMVNWAAGYYVQAGVILKWVNHLQELKQNGTLNHNLWITSSDNFASWGGGDSSYHKADLELLIKAVDYVSLHTYPMHDTHYNPAFWGIKEQAQSLPATEQIELAMDEALSYARQQYEDAKTYVHSIAPNKPIHIGETGWASASNGFYGPDGSKATDEYKEARYYAKIRNWTDKEGISCFYFEAFDEPWKDAGNAGGSENHFGLFTVDGQAKYALWKLVDQGLFKGLTRGGNAITKTYEGNEAALMKAVKKPPLKKLKQGE